MKWKHVMNERIGEHRKGYFKRKKDKSEGKDDNKRGREKLDKKQESY